MHGVARGADKYLALVVDHTQAGIVAHAAAAHRVHRDQLVVLRFGPERVGNEIPVDGVVGLLEKLVVARDHGRLAGTRPIDAQAVVTQGQGAGGIVHAHHQVSLGARRRPGVGHRGHGGRVVHDGVALALRFEQARGGLVGPVLQEIAEQGVGHEGGGRNGGGHGAGDHALFDHQAVLHPFGILAHVDDAGDAGAGLRQRRDVGVAAAADAVQVGVAGVAVGALGIGRPMVVVAEAQHITVAGEALSQLGR